MRRVSIAGIVLLVVMIASLIAACTPEAETTTPPPANGGATTPAGDGGAPAAETITLSFATFESEAHYRIPVMNWSRIIPKGRDW